jgi:hypothetical protein
VVIAGVFGGPVAALLSHSGRNFEDPEAESVPARELIERASGVSPEVAVVVLVEPGGDVTTGRGARRRVELVGARRSAVAAQAKSGSVRPRQTEALAPGGQPTDTASLIVAWHLNGHSGASEPHTDENAGLAAALRI